MKALVALAFASLLAGNVLAQQPPAAPESLITKPARTIEQVCDHVLGVGRHVARRLIVVANHSGDPGARRPEGASGSLVGEQRGMWCCLTGK